MTLSTLFFMAPQGGGSVGMTVLLLQIGAFVAIFYFLIIRPQSQARKIKENRITIESGTARLVIDRSRIVQVGDEVSPSANQP
jgi:preprotein translocase subunit YajC